MRIYYSPIEIEPRGGQLGRACEEGVAGWVLWRHVEKELPPQREVKPCELDACYSITPKYALNRSGSPTQYLNWGRNRCGGYFGNHRRLQFAARKSRPGIFNVR